MTVLTSQRIQFTHALFEHLAGYDYILLKYTADSPELLGPGTDLDILLPSGMPDKLVSFLTHHPDVDFIKWEHWSSYSQAYIFFKDGTFLELDFLFRLVRKEWEYLPLRMLLANKRKMGTIVTYTNQFLLEHAVLYNFLNHSGLTDKYIRYFEALPAEEQEELVVFFNVKYGTFIREIRELKTINAEIHRSILKHLRDLPENGLLRRAIRFAAYCQDVSRKILRKPTEVITFSGVDGAGKSTILEQTRQVLKSVYRQNVVVLRHRPGLLPILSAMRHGKAGAEAKAAVTLPHSGKNQSTLGSLLRFLYYFIDYFFGQAYVWLRYRIHGTIVLYDRYFFDFIADPRRSNVQLPNWFTRFCYRFLAKPDLNFFLYAPPEVILARKQELSRETLVRLTAAYKDLFDDLAATRPEGYFPIENIDLQNTMNFIVFQYVQNLRLRAGHPKKELPEELSRKTTEPSVAAAQPALEKV